MTTDPTDAIGIIEKPPGTSYYAPTDVNELPMFLSTMLTLVAIAMGIWVLVNVIIAGYTALTSSGDAQATNKIRTSITNSVIGLLLIVLAYTLAALAGLIFFGDPTLFTAPSF